MADVIVRESMAGIMMGQCSMLCRKSPRGVSACVTLMKRGRPPQLGFPRWKRRPRRDSDLGGPNDTKNVTLQIGNNKLSILGTVSRIDNH